MKRKMTAGHGKTVSKPTSAPPMHGMTAKRTEPDVRPTAKRATSKLKKLDGKLI